MYHVFWADYWMKQVLFNSKYPFQVTDRFSKNIESSIINTGQGNFIVLLV